MKREELINKVHELAVKYDPMSHKEKGFSNDIYLNESIALPEDSDGEKDSVIAFYTHNRDIFCITDNMYDIDPLDFDDELLEKFVNYISDETNLSTE